MNELKSDTKPMTIKITNPCCPVNTIYNLPIFFDFFSPRIFLGYFRYRDNKIIVSSSVCIIVFKNVIYYRYTYRNRQRNHFFLEPRYIELRWFLEEIIK